MSKKKGKQHTASRGKSTKSVKVGAHTRSIPKSSASSKSLERTTSCSKLVEKAGFLVYTGPVHGDLTKALDEQREARSDQLQGS